MQYILINIIKKLNIFKTLIFISQTNQSIEPNYLGHLNTTLMTSNKNGAGNKVWQSLYTMENFIWEFTAFQAI